MSIENEWATFQDGIGDAFSPHGRAHVLLRTLRSFKQLRPSLREASGQDWTSLFEHSLIVLVGLSVTHMPMKRTDT